MKRFVFSMLMIFAAFSLSACNTIEGAGKDIKKVGDKIEKTAEKSKN